jgi:PPOX class probable F420-dependent enzyme
VVGVAASTWDDEAFRRHAAEAVRRREHRVDEASFNRFADSLTYVQGAHRDRRCGLARRLARSRDHPRALTATRRVRQSIGMGVLTDEARAALTAGHLAHLVTTNPDGSPQVTVVWVGLEGDEIVSGHLVPRQKLRNVVRDPRVAVSLETGGIGAFGLAEYLVVYGRGRITEGGAPELLQRLAQVYIGPGVRFPPMDDPPSGYVLRITPTRLGGAGSWSPLRG